MESKDIKIEKILSENLITDWLSAKGFTKSYSSKLYHVYKCPFPDHDDSTASFIVYDRPGSCQNYYCWGCKKSGNLLSLIKSIDKKEWSEVVKDLGGDYEVSNHETVNYILGKISKNNIENEVRNIIGELSVGISDICYLHLKNSQFNRNEYLFLENIYSVVDDIIEREDIGGLAKLYDFLQDGDESTNGLSPFFLRYNNENFNNL